MEECMNRLGNEVSEEVNGNSSGIGSKEDSIERN